MKSQTNTGYVAFLSLVAAIGGILFGYDTAVISGTISGVAAQFSLDAMQQGWFVGCALVGSIGGVAVAGVLSDRFGRKLTMLLSAVLFTVSAVGCAVSADFTQLVVYRIVGGVGIGVVSIVSPMYISEVAVARWRGTLVSLYQLAITVGFLAAYLVNFQILKSAETAVYASPWMQKIWVTELWRGMFGAETLPALLFFTVIFFIPESPRWLATKLQYGKAENILSHIGGKEYAKKEIESIKTVISATKEKLNIRMLFQGKIPGILLIGIVIAAFQQWCGLNVVFNYAQEIFAAAGYGVSDILFNIVVTGVTNVIFTFVGMYTVDKLGRRSLMLFGASGLAIIYIIMGICYYLNITGMAVLIMVVLAIACYAMTLAPVTWVVLSEIFPNRIRGMAMAVSTFSLWVACFVLTYTFPLLNSGLGAYGTFWLYGIICILGFVFIKIKLPETKGKSLESIEKELTS